MGIEDLIFRLIGVNRLAVTIEQGKPSQASLEDLQKLLEDSTDSIKAVSGELPYEVYGADGLVEVIEEAIKDRGVTVEVVVGKDADEKSLARLVSVGGLVYQLDGWPPVHFVIVDGEDVRLEEPHIRGAKKRTSYTIDNFKNAKEWELRFEQIKEQAKPWTESC